MKHGSVPGLQEAGQAGDPAGCCRRPWVIGQLWGHTKKTGDPPVQKNWTATLAEALVVGAAIAVVAAAEVVT